MAHLHVIAGAEAHPAHPTIRTITVSDLLDSLARGWADFSAMPSHALFLCLIYPVVAIFAFGLTMGYNILPLASRSWPALRSSASRTRPVAGRRPNC